MMSTHGNEIMQMFNYSKQWNVYDIVACKTDSVMKLWTMACLSPPVLQADLEEQTYILIDLKLGIFIGFVIQSRIRDYHSHVYENLVQNDQVNCSVLDICSNPGLFYIKVLQCCMHFHRNMPRNPDTSMKVRAKW